MAWSATIPGQPPSLNDLYRVVPRTSHEGRRYYGIGKNPHASTYHDDVLWIVRSARPSAWRPAGEFRIRVRLFLKRKIDTDNCLKTLSDAIQTALGINDDQFLWCVIERQIGVKDPRVELEFCDDASHA